MSLSSETVASSHETRSTLRIVTADRGGFDILHRGAIYWARTYALAAALAEVLASADFGFSRSASRLEAM